MPDSAVEIDRVCKSYRLYSSMAGQALGAFGLDRLMIWRKPAPLFRALDGVSFNVRKGERLAIIGRNGAGKSTLLKMIARNLRPDSGAVAVHGGIQSMMTMGLGFHPDFSGADNIRASLAYNGLASEDMRSAIGDVVDFCELGAFIDQPLRTYSAGMRTRLYFACATAIKPDILIVDEVLGAGDDYFAARSAARMRQLAHSGCTLLLVSHSTQQLMEYCERAIWLECGRVVMDGAVLPVVKAYEEFTQRLSGINRAADTGAATAQDQNVTTQLLGEILARDGLFDSGDGGLAAGGISRWPASGLVKLENIVLRNESGQAAIAFAPGETFQFDFQSVIEAAGHYCCRYVMVVFGEDGRWVTRVTSPPHAFSGAMGSQHGVAMRFAPLLLRPGHYVVSISAHAANEPWDLLTAERYDLISRSFAFDVVGEAKAQDPLIRHPVSWRAA